ncbi:MAG: nonstructural protein [Microvirus sp.]|nr:MAG: nonstructural protein [Microvirus sp.]
MRFVVVAISDRAVGAYMRPFVAPSKGAAVRAFSDGVRGSESEMGKHPEDYELHFLGWFDDQSGVFDVAEGQVGEVLARAINFKE